MISSLFALFSPGDERKDVTAASGHYDENGNFVLLLRTGRALSVMEPYGMKANMTVFPQQLSQVQLINDPANFPQNPDMIDPQRGINSGKNMPWSTIRHRRGNHYELKLMN